MASKMKRNTILLMVIAGIIDALILLSGWFVVFFDFKVTDESQLMNQQQDSKFNFDIPNLQKLIEFIQLHSIHPYQIGNILKEEKEDSIGFRIDKKEREEPDDSLPDSLRTGYHQKPSNKTYQGLIEDIQSGIYDYRTLMKRHSVNVMTVKKYLELYRVEA